MFACYKCYILIELTFQKGLMLIKQVHQKSVMIATIGYSLNYSFKFQPNVCNRYHNLLMISINLSDCPILKIKGSGYRCIISLISTNKAMNLLQNVDLTGKKRNIIKHKKLIFICKNG